METELIEVLKMAGLQDARITNYFNCFRATSKEAIAKKYGVQGVNVYAQRAQAS